MKPFRQLVVIALLASAGMIGVGLFAAETPQPDKTPMVIDAGDGTRQLKLEVSGGGTPLVITEKDIEQQKSTIEKLQAELKQMRTLNEYELKISNFYQSEAVNCRAPLPAVSVQATAPPK